MKLVKFNLLAIVSAILFFSCNTEDDTYEIGDVFDNSSSNVFYTDTLTVNAHTVLIDSFICSGYNKVFVGYKEDEYLGNISAKSFIPIGFSDEAPAIDEDATFDSLVLVLTPSGAYLGDTNLYQGISVHEITDTIEPFDDGYFYNNTSFAYKTEPLNKVKFKLYPAKQKQLYISFPDEMGEMWFDSIQSGADEFESTYDFEAFFRGLVIIPEVGAESWSATFNGLDEDAEGTGVEIRLYYSVPNEEGNFYYSFVPTNSSYIFSNFDTDFASTSIETLNEDNDQISSKETDDLIFMQSGSGLCVKIDIPMLEHINEINNNISILDAELIVRPHSGSYNKNNPLPTSFNAYWTDKKNRIGDQLYNLTGEYALTASLYVDDEYNESTYYSIPLLNYLLVEIARDEYSDNDLMFIISPETFATSFNRIVLDDRDINNLSMQLRIHYLTY